MTKIIGLVCVGLLLGVSLAAGADSGVEEIWQCTLKKGKKIEEAMAANTAWVKWVNVNIAGGGIQSSTATPIVGDMSSLIFIDSFPSLESWAAMKTALESPEGKKVEAAINEVVECTENRVYRSTPN
jgi:hypothetical protein